MKKKDPNESFWKDIDECCEIMNADELEKMADVFEQGVRVVRATAKAYRRAAAKSQKAWTLPNNRN